MGMLDGKVCIVTGLVLGSPWIFWQIWMFVAAGLYPHEKRYVNIYLPFSLFLFLGGVFICQFFVIPKALEALLKTAASTRTGARAQQLLDALRTKVE